MDVPAPDGPISKWTLENLGWLFTSVWVAILGIFGWLIRDNRKEVEVDDLLKAHEEKIIDAKKVGHGLAETQNLAHQAVLARFDSIGGEFRSYREQAAEKFATREDLRLMAAHLQDLLGHVNAGQVQIAAQVTRLNDKLDDRDARLGQRYDKLYEAVLTKNSS